MAKIKVYPFIYYDAEQGIQIEGSGMCTGIQIDEMRKKDPSKNHQMIVSRGIEIDDSELSGTDRYYPPDNDPI